MSHAFLIVIPAKAGISTLREGAVGKTSPFARVTKYRRGRA